jgi:hypothetical protein
MTNETERKFDHQQPKPTDTPDQFNKKNPTQESGKHLPTQQDPSKKNPSQTDDSQPRDGEKSEQGDRRRAS